MRVFFMLTSSAPVLPGALRKSAPLVRRVVPLLISLSVSGCPETSDTDDKSAFDASTERDASATQASAEDNPTPSPDTSADASASSMGPGLGVTLRKDAGAPGLSVDLDTRDASTANEAEAGTRDASADPTMADAAVEEGGRDQGTLTEPDAGLADATLPTSEIFLGETDVTLAEVLGYYSGDWGEMLLRQVGDEVWGAYTHDDGTVVGTLEGDTFVGWWSEVPSREPRSDAGEVEFRWFRDEAGAVQLDGRWRYGAEADGNDFREDWDLTAVPDTAGPQSLLERFDDPSQFRGHP